MSEDGLTVVIRELIERHYAELDKLRDEIRDRDEKIATLQQMLERAMEDA